MTLGASIGYAEAEELIEQLQAVGKNLNTKTFDQVVNGGKFASFSKLPAGGPGKLEWPAAHFLPPDCSVIVQGQGDGLQAGRALRLLPGRQDQRLSRSSFGAPEKACSRPFWPAAGLLG